MLKDMLSKEQSEVRNLQEQIEQIKAQEKDDVVQAMQRAKQLETTVRELKNKL
jgi:16S rRNA U1498 N3-methylase RsmE